MPLVLHQGCPSQVVEIVDAVARHARLHRCHQRQPLGDGGREPCGSQREDKVRKHQPLRRARKASRSNRCTSCSFFSSAPCSGGITTCFSLLRRISGDRSSTISSFNQSSSSGVAGFFFIPGTS